ncbi:DNA ligase D [Methylobacillus caricis]|uniref:DNA ligase D n=1 Tax=Methylobacillus caricis TaxID=1971611 RepID=UPI001CFFC9D4|nr:DNA ligase D [Methylobacillus caricis]MCB5186757.1 DNA ligase D [Methylobacillus caricis]
MGLQQYWGKRDFKLTHEPRGKVEKSGRQLAFYIQKHDARRLHYDFRLELQGTLKSWAVPKGPSLDPNDKRLAVEVEDHPVEYGTFEGDIPKGQYGAGHVMLWDKGTWEAIGDPVEGYRQGALKFRLNGVKLRGKWALVRMKAKPGEKDNQPNWLLIKEKDEEARHGPEAQITETATASVSLIQDDGPALESVDGDLAMEAAPTKQMPDLIKPQLATLVTQAPQGDQWFSEIKYDGYRALARIEHGDVKIYSRNGNDWTNKWKNLAGALAKLPVESAWLDGEVVAFDEEGGISFQALQTSFKLGNEADLAYFIFDLPYLNGHDLTKQPLKQRKLLLQTLLESQGKQGPLHFSEHLEGHASEVLKHACMHGLEGIVVKHAESPYQQRRSSDWLKVKCGQRQEFVVAGYTDPSGRREEFGALLLGVYDEEGMLQYAGRVGTGFNQGSLRLIASQFKTLHINNPAFANPPTGRDALGAHWLKPTLVAEVKFAEWTSAGRIRHASFVGLRDDKAARHVTHETAQPTERLAGSGEGVKNSSQSSPSPVEVANIRISHPSKTLFTDGGFTKLDLARYYESVANWILPYLKDRPLSIVRCPEGYDQHCFFQKHVSLDSKSHLKAVNINTSDKNSEYFSANNLSAVIELVQLGVLELHAWGSRSPKTHLADKMIFDLDPAPGLSWGNVTEAALLLHGLLEELELRSFVKTTGGKGLHIEIPIKPEHSWEVVKEFTHGIARHLQTHAPDRFTTNLSKKKRDGLIFIDYLRNSAGATAVVPYSTRAKAFAPVATPLDWDEVGPEVQADTFNIGNVMTRLENMESDPWKDYLQTKQRLSAKLLQMFT